jgi:broad specificity phosphatase PhoE
VFLKSRGVRFESVYTSPLDRAQATALLVARVILHGFELGCAEGGGVYNWRVNLGIL